jgi:hypothetical protein
MCVIVIFVSLAWSWAIIEWIRAPYFDEDINNKNNDYTIKSNDSYNKDV